MSRRFLGGLQIAFDRRPANAVDSAPVTVVGKIGYLGAAIALSLALAGELSASDVLFKNGQQMRNVRVVFHNDDFVSIVMPNGMVRYPVSALAAIDGRPVGAAATPASEPAKTDDAPAFQVDSPAWGSAAPSSAPAATPAGAPSEAAPAPSASDPAAPAAPPAVETKAGNVVLAAGAREKTAPDQWNFALLLAGILVVGGIWMRSLQAVQKDLFERRAEPRGWTLAALLAPGLGAAAYFASRMAREKIRAVQIKKVVAANSAPSDPLPVASGTGMAFPVLPKRPDPADYLAAKATTRKGLTFLDSDRKSIELARDGEMASGLDNANEMLEEALLEKASDIHVEPTGSGYRVRFRLDGILHERMSYDSGDGLRLVTAVKSLAEIDIAEKRRAQDGKFRAQGEGREVDFRVATANSIYGEKLVIRVLDHRGGIFDLATLGMAEEMLATFNAVVHSKNGMILATGPTGSGKTSTLYAALRQLDATSLNIMTIEDPAEYELPGATQIAVNPRAGITYEAGLRSILRQDPDVILVGEMRDAEASSVALRAALTGHLVLSTLHTKGAIGTISRLQDMGIERYQIASALLMVVAQRLVRVLCPDCREEYPAVGNELESLGFTFEPGSPLYAARGCDACLGTGFRGRTGLFELLVLDDEFRRLVGDGADEATLTAEALARGFKSFRHDGAEKVLAGVTTVGEVLEAS